MMLAEKSPVEIEHGLNTLDPTFISCIGSLNVVSQETARESNPIATCLAALFTAYRHALTADMESTSLGKSSKTMFLERFQIKFVDEDTIEGVLARDLFVALKRVSREYGLTFNMTSVQQFAQRFSNDMDTIRQAGFEITVVKPNGNARRTSSYTIKKYIE